MDFKIIPATDISLADQAVVVNAAFAGYVGGWTEMDATALARFLMLQGTDLYYSRFIQTAEGLAGFGYINRTGDVLRLGGMALLPSARGTGAAAHLLLHLLDEGKLRGDATMMLEVIEQNPRAVALYRRHGFREMARLSGWRRSAESGDALHSDASLDEVPILRALAMRSAREYPDIPCQISRHAIAKVERTRAFRRADECVIISNPQTSPIRVYGLFSPSEDWSKLRDILTGVLHRFPNHEFFAPPLWPEEYGREIFQPLGFRRESITQFLMRRDL